MRSNDPSPERVAETIRRLDNDAVAPLNAYWLSVIGDRTEYAQRLQPLLSEHGIGVLIVRNSGFTNANALMVDLVDLLSGNRVPFLEALARRPRDTGRIGIVLLSHRELALGQAYSPVTWPSWVPGVGGRETTCFITDISRRVEVRLDAPEICSDQVNGALFSVEEALLRRLIEVHDQSPGEQQQLCRRIQRRSDPSWVSLLRTAEKKLMRTECPQSYRPPNCSIVARLWELSLGTPPAQLASVQPELATALGITDNLLPTEHWEGLATVLSRDIRASDAPVDRFCRTVLTTVPAACQFVTCAAHADFYQPFPINLLTAVVDDLYKTLTTIEMSLIHLSDSSAARAAS